ncbi:MAG TPA: DUF2382 domain-containing protein [Allosphingosinicella sp.]|jgi:stress response protein YsnF
MADEEERVVLPLIEERMVVGKRKFETGKVRVRSDVEKHIDIARLRLERERVEITCIVKDQEVAGPAPRRKSGDLRILSILEEMLRVRKRLAPAS